MNNLGCQFSDESKTDLVEFLKVADEMKNDSPYCDLEDYERLKRLFPLDDAIKCYADKPKISIDLTRSEDDRENVENRSSETELDKMEELLSQTSAILTKASTEDIVYSIKEHLATKQPLPAMLLRNLNRTSCGDLEEVFKILGEQLNLEEVLDFWLSIQEFADIGDELVHRYITLLFLQKAKLQYCEEAQSVFLRLSVKYYAILKKELANELYESNSEKNDQIRVLIQYISSSSNNFKIDFLREFIFNCDKLRPHYIPVVESLLNSQTEYDLLDKIVEVMSNAVEEYAVDKSYGKLLFNVVKLLDKDVIRLEQPLKHILGVHRSIWKTKVDKIVLGRFEDCLTQSFR